MPNKDNNPGGLTNGQWHTIQERARGSSFDQIAESRTGDSSRSHTRRNEASQAYERLGTHSLVGAVRRLVESEEAPIEAFVDPQQVSDFRERFGHLTAAEQDVLRHMMDDPKSNTVAQARSTSPRTTSNQRASIANKLGMKPDIAAVRLYASELQRSSEKVRQQNS